MKNFFTKTEAGYVCSHPKVDKFWLWGGGGRTDDGVFHLQQGSTLLFKNGDRGDVECGMDDDIIEKCNELLNTIPE